MKKLLLACLFFIAVSNLAFAEEKIPVSITPNQFITTKKDLVEFGDTLAFKVTKDVYKDDMIFIKKNAPVIAEVDYVNPNGWAADTAYIQIKKFKILDSQNKWIDVCYPLKILGSGCKKTNANGFLVGLKKVIAVVRGQEVVLVPSQQDFNIFILN